MFGLTLMFALHFVRTHGQSVTIDKEPAPVAYYRMPDKPLDPAYSTYSADIRVYSGDLLRAGISEASLRSEYLVLDGYTRVANNGDVHIEAQVSDFTVFSERRESRQRRTKDKQGKEIITTFYWIEVKYALPVSMTVSNKKGHVLDDNFIFTLTDQRAYSTPQQRSISDLDRYWRINRTRQLAELHKDILTDAFKKIYENVNNSFGYIRITNENARFETIGRKRHKDYVRFRNAYETINKGFKLMDPDKSLNPVRKAVEPALAFYQNQAPRYSANDKDALKLKHICLYNLALAYFWLEDFDAAKKFAEEMIALDDRDRDARRLLEDIQEVRESISRAQRVSRHQKQVSGT